MNRTTMHAKKLSLAFSFTLQEAQLVRGSAKPEASRDGLRDLT